jgi:hypothetical protein
LGFARTSHCHEEEREAYGNGAWVKVMPGAKQSLAEEELVPPDIDGPRGVLPDIL